MQGWTKEREKGMKERKAKRSVGAVEADRGKLVRALVGYGYGGEVRLAAFALSSNHPR